MNRNNKRKNGSVKRALAVGLTGVTVLSTIPSAGLPVVALEGETRETPVEFGYAEYVNSGITSRVYLNNTVSSYWYFDDATGALSMREDTVARFELQGTATGIRAEVNGTDITSSEHVVVEGNHIDIPAMFFKNGETVEVFYTLEDGTETSATLSDYLASRFPTLTGYSADSEAPELSLVSITRVNPDGLEESFDETKAYKGGSLKLVYDMDLASDDESSVILNGNPVDTSMLSYDAGLKQLTVNLDFDSIQETGVSEYNLVVGAYDRLENTSRVEQKFILDYDAPSLSISLLNGGVVDGDTLYFDKAVRAKYSYEGVDNVSGMEVLTRYIDGIQSSSRSSNVFTTTLSGENTFDREGEYTFLVRDNLGNEKTYTLGELVGASGNKIAFDESDPTVSATFNGSSTMPEDWVKGEAKLQLSFNDDTKIKKVKYTINGVETTKNYDESSPVLDLDLSNESGMVVFNCIAYDVIGNEVSFNQTFKIDNEKPTVNGLEVEGRINISEDKVYIKNGGVLKGIPTDAESGIAKVEILKGTEVVGDSLPYNIEETGVYSVRVMDNVGNVAELALSDVLNHTTGGVVVDKDSPVISRLEGFSPDLVKSNINWYKDVPEFKYSIVDSNLSSISIKVDDTEVTSTIDSSNEYTVTIPNEDGEHVVTVVAEDKVGNIVEDTYTFRLDTANPYILTGSVNISGHDKSNALYYNENPCFTIVGTAAGVGTSSYNLYDANGNLLESREDGKFTVSTGEYFVQAVNVFGRKSDKVALRSILGLSSNKIIVDTNKPTITCSRPEGGLNGWFSDDVEYTADVADLIGIEKAEISVNGVVVDSYSLDGSGKEDTLVASTGGITPNADYSYNILVSVTDFAGNTETWEDTVYVDKDVPFINSISFNSEYKNKDFGVFFKDNPNLIVSASDAGVGLDKVILVNKDGVEEESASGVFTLLDGEYTVKLKDKLGNITTAGSLKDLLSLSSNSICIDKSKPTISCSRPSGDLSSWYAGDVEYVAEVTSEKGIAKTAIYVNGVKVDSLDSVDGVVTSKELRASTSGIEPKNGYAYEIKIVAENNAGGTSEWADTIHIDKSAPVLSSCKFMSNYSDTDDGVFFKSKPDLYLSALDSGVGLKNYILVDKSGNEIKNTTGVFSLGNGEYTVKLEDNLGNVSTVGTLKDILNLKTNSIVIDGVQPSISCSRPSGDLNGWFNKDVEYVAKISDNIGISSATMSINGVVVSDSSSGNWELRGNIGSVPCADDGSYRVEVRVVDYAGNESTWSDLVYKDTSAPVIDRFTINNPEYIEGSDIGGSDKYGFYIKGATSVGVSVSDGNISSGMDKVYYTLISSSGSEMNGTADISGGVANIQIPEGFKGYLKAYATDKVGNKGAEAKPDGIISENSNVHVNTAKIDISLPSTGSFDLSGNNLYSGGISIGADISDSISGIRKVEWGVDGETRGTLNIDNNGSVSGDMSTTIKGADKNLVTLLSSSVAVTDNKNNSRVWFRVTDRVGNVSESSKVISIDKDTPVIDVTYDSTNDSKYYNNTRVATVKVTERNFRASDVSFSGAVGNVGQWVNAGGDTWVTSVTFSEDGEYVWSVNYTDLAGNKAVGYSSETFTVDKTAPQLNVSFDNNSSENGEYFKEGRTATITINEKNFDPSLVTYTGAGQITNWVSSGDMHTAKVAFDEDGIYNFAVGVQDKANNTTGEFSSGQFIVDKSAPTLNIDGIQDGISYKKNVSFNVSVDDTNIDAERSTVELVGRVNGEVKLTGGFNGTSGNFSFEGVSEEKEFDDLYKLKATIYDKAGNVTEQELLFSINRYGSAYDFLEEHLLNNIVAKAKDVHITETSVDRLDMTRGKVVIIRDGNEISVDDKYISIAESGGEDGPWVYEYTINKKAFSKDGKYQVQVYSQALDGTNNSSLTEEYAFMLDSTEPEVIISGISEGEIYRDVSKKVAIEVRDLSGVGKIEAWLNGSKVKLSEEGGIYYLTVNESPKGQKLVVKVTDKAGNVTSSEVDDFTITTNILISLLNSPWFKVGVGVVSAGVLAMLGLIFRKWRKNKKKELETAQENAKLYRDSTTGSGSEGTETAETTETK